MRTGDVLRACALALLAGCPRSPDDVTPHRDAAVAEAGDDARADDDAPGDAAHDAPEDTRGDAPGDTPGDAPDDVAEAGRGDASGDAGADAPGPEAAVDGGVVTPSMTFTFVGGAMRAREGDRAIAAQLVWHGVIRATSADGRTTINAVIH